MTKSEALRVRMTEYVPVKMTPAELAALRSVADERSCSVGAVVRWAVRKALLEPTRSPQEITGEDGGDIKIVFVSEVEE